MATIKAGTYRFNDVLSVPSSKLTPEISFDTIIGNGELSIRLHCVGMTVLTSEYQDFGLSYAAISSEPNILNEIPQMFLVSNYNEFSTSVFGDKVQTITIPNDTEVSSEFYEWFTANAVEQKEISGKWRFNEVLTRDLRYGEYVVNFSFISEKSGYLINCQADRFTIENTTEGTGAFRMHYTIISMNPDLGASLPLVANAYSYYPEISDSGWLNSYGEGIKTIDFGTEPQTVSAEFYHWMTANAVPAMASITHNGSTIAELFPGQTATLKCKGMKMEDDVVVEVAKQSGGECNHEVYAGETANAFFGIPKAKIEKPTETSLGQFNGGDAARPTDDIEAVFGANCACKYTQSDWGDYLNLQYKTDGAEDIVDITYAWEEDLETLRNVLPYMGIDASQLTSEGWYWLGSGAAIPVTEEERLSMYCITAFDFLTPCDKEAYFYSLFDFYAGTPSEHTATPCVAVVDGNVFATNAKLCNGDIVKLETGRYYPHDIDSNRNDNGIFVECVSLKNKNICIRTVGVNGQAVHDKEWSIRIDVVYMNPKTGELESFSKIMTNENYTFPEFISGVYSKHVKAIEYTAVSGVSIENVVTNARKVYYGRSISGLYPITEICFLVDKTE